MSGVDKRIKLTKPLPVSIQSGNHDISLATKPGKPGLWVVHQAILSERKDVRRAVFFGALMKPVLGEQLVKTRVLEGGRAYATKYLQNFQTIGFFADLTHYSVERLNAMRLPYYGGVMKAVGETDFNGFNVAVHKNKFTAFDTDYQGHFFDFDVDHALYHPPVREYITFYRRQHGMAGDQHLGPHYWPASRFFGVVKSLARDGSCHDIQCMGPAKSATVIPLMYTNIDAIVQQYEAILNATMLPEAYVRAVQSEVMKDFNDIVTSHVFNFLSHQTRMRAWLLNSWQFVALFLERFDAFEDQLLEYYRDYNKSFHTPDGVLKPKYATSKLVIDLAQVSAELEAMRAKAVELLLQKATGYAGCEMPEDRLELRSLIFFYRALVQQAPLTAELAGIADHVKQKINEGVRYHLHQQADEIDGIEGHHFMVIYEVTLVYSEAFRLAFQASKLLAEETHLEFKEFGLHFLNVINRKIMTLASAVITKFSDIFYAHMQVTWVKRFYNATIAMLESYKGLDISVFQKVQYENAIAYLNQLLAVPEINVLSLAYRAQLVYLQFDKIDLRFVSHLVEKFIKTLHTSVDLSELSTICLKLSLYVEKGTAPYDMLREKYIHLKQFILEKADLLSIGPAMLHFQALSVLFDDQQPTAEEITVVEHRYFDLLAAKTTSWDLDIAYSNMVEQVLMIQNDRLHRLPDTDYFYNAFFGDFESKTLDLQLSTFRKYHQHVKYVAHYVVEAMPSDVLTKLILALKIPEDAEPLKSELVMCRRDLLRMIKGDEALIMLLEKQLPAELYRDSSPASDCRAYSLPTASSVSPARSNSTPFADSLVYTPPTPTDMGEFLRDEAAAQGGVVEEKPGL